jgi:hypothetical protein
MSERSADLDGATHRSPRLGVLAVVFVGLFLASVAANFMMTGGVPYPIPYNPVEQLQDLLHAISSRDARRVLPAIRGLNSAWSVYCHRRESPVVPQSPCSWCLHRTFRRHCSGCIHGCLGAGHVGSITAWRGYRYGRDAGGLAVGIRDGRIWAHSYFGTAARGLIGALSGV